MLYCGVDSRSTNHIFLYSYIIIFMSKLIEKVLTDTSMRTNGAASSAAIVLAAEEYAPWYN